MTTAVRCRSKLFPGGIGFVAAVICAVVAGSGTPLNSSAQPAPSVSQKTAPEQGPRFADLPPSQRLVLQPLEKQWAGINTEGKQKWISIAGQFAGLPADERARIQTQMSEWSRLSPAERGQVRMQFQQATKAAPQNRQAQWEVYQALPAEQKRQLASRAASAPNSAPARPSDAVRRTELAAKQSRDTALTKSNIVPNPNLAPQPRWVAPTVVQAQPGATTNLISKRMTPPAHQQTGMPKIAATHGFVDASTLLPRRGAQGAAAGAVAASSPSSRP